MSNEEKAKEISLKLFENGHFTHNAISQRKEIEKSLIEMAEWKEQQMIEKALNWIHDNLCYYDEDGFDADGNGILGDFKKAMEEE